ncbi:MAG: DUF2993 domain-containing protein [Thermostichales cyanobacterium SZTDM-1c_bins_54]
MIGPVYGQLLGTLLSPLVAAWIRSQVQGVEDLQVNIRGADNELLNGFIPQAQVSGRNLRYEGVAVSQVSLQGQNIRLNVPAALQGSPLQLLQAVPVQVGLVMTEADLNQTLQSPLIQAQLAQAKVTLPIGTTSVPFLIRDPKVRLVGDRLQIDAQLSSEQGPPVPVSLATRVVPTSPQQLALRDPVWLIAGQEIPIAGLNNLPIDLGPEVQIQQLKIENRTLVYRGVLVIQSTVPTPAARF